MPNFKKNTSPFMMKGFSGFGNSPLKQSYPSSAQKGSYGPTGTLDEVKRVASEKAAKTTKAANAKKYGMESLNKAINKRLKPDPQLTFKKKLSTPKSTAKDLMKRQFKAFSHHTPKIIKKGAAWAAKRLGPLGLGLTAVDAVTTVPKVVKATQKHLETEAKERSTKSAQTLFRGPKY